MNKGFQNPLDLSMGRLRCGDSFTVAFAAMYRLPGKGITSTSPPTICLRTRMHSRVLGGSSNVTTSPSVEIIVAKNVEWVIAIPQGTLSAELHHAIEAVRALGNEFQRVLRTGQLTRLDGLHGFHQSPKRD